MDLLTLQMSKLQHWCKRRLFKIKTKTIFSRGASTPRLWFREPHHRIKSDDNGWWVESYVYN